MVPDVTRRSFLAGCATMIANAQNLRPAVDAVDHLLLGVSDLDRGIAWVEQRTGIKAAIGGVHPGRGTRNALLSLGRQRYLEIIAPDPAQSAYTFQIDVRGLAEPRLINWAVATGDIEGVTARARRAGLEVFGPADGSRQTPSGKTLRWKSLGIASRLGEAAIQPVPFFIQWAPESTHPSQDSPAGCELESLQFWHTNSQSLLGNFEVLGIATTVNQSASVSIAASIRTPKGVLELT